MDKTAIARRQMLLWGANEFKADGSRYIHLGMALQLLEDLLFGKRGDGKRARLLFDSLVEKGAFIHDDEAWALGPNYDTLLSAVSPVRRTLAPEELDHWVGKFSFQRIDFRGDLGASPEMAAGLSELMCRQVEGTLSKVEGVEPGRIRAVERWNNFVETGLLSRELIPIVRGAVESASASFKFKELTHDELPAITTHMNTCIATGQMAGEKLHKITTDYASYWDFKTGEQLDADFEGWDLKFYTTRSEDNYERRPLELYKRFPEVVHMEIGAGSPIYLLSASDIETFSKALHAAHVKDMDLPVRFNADVGALEWAIQTYEQTGVMGISFGDHFPKPVREKATGRVMLLDYGEVVSAKECRELEAKGDEDLLRGYLLADDPRFEILGGAGLEHLTLATEDHLLSLACAKGDITKEAALAILEEATQGNYARAHRFEALPERVHLYIPHGRSIEQFDAACQRSGLKEDLPYCGRSLILSPEPITFSEDTVVLDVDVTAPELEIPSAPSP